ncbi:type I restriction endonuclease [Bifidobacterium bifidum]|uniref:type I restriction endonuclease n=1 Tax=Bifidobacterium bifidum TaxID=1681 RepID=UPI003267CEC3
MQSSDPDLPQVEYEDIVSGEGTLNKDLRDKEGGKTGIKFYAGDVLYGKLRPYLMNWLYPQFNGVAVGDFWVLRATECDSSFLYRLVQTDSFQRLANVSSGSKMPRADWNLISQSFFAVPADYAEQRVIAKSLAELDDLITLHQRKRESRIIRVRSFIWLAGDISGIGVSAYQPEKRRPYDRRQHQRRNVVLRLLRAMDQRIQGRCNS